LRLNILFAAPYDWQDMDASSNYAERVLLKLVKLLYF